jgi:arabinose-5-phosphate isomerase
MEKGRVPVYVNEGIEIIQKEAQGLWDISNRLDHNFSEAVTLLFNISPHGKVVVMGIGKSGYIGRKIASTLTSTGTPSFFMNPTDAIHGELGVLTKEDIALIISNSGETKELLDIIPFLKKHKIKIINICGKQGSSLWKNADANLDISVASEADHNNLAPTTSTTAAVAMGDALAVVTSKALNFKTEDFAKLHPGGSLGKRLTMKVSDLMFTGNRVPKVNTDATVKDALFVLTKLGLGIAIIVDSDDKLLGVFTDGDLRRLADHEPQFINKKIHEVMKKSPKTIAADELAYTALSKMKNAEITALVVVGSDKKVIGVLNIHEILREGIS